MTDLGLAPEIAETADKPADRFGLSRRSKWDGPRSWYSMPSLKACGEHRGGDGEDGFLGAATGLGAKEVQARYAAGTREEGGIDLWRNISLL
jgi:hypothetical protein